MIKKPEDQISLDDSEGADKDDQLSQQDVHSNGLNEERIPGKESVDPPIDLLKQSFDAAESSFTLFLDDAELPPEKD
ncbi:hypothetical protein [Mucilaginibacter celer]|uniref:Uncharacterized protein n=1 Tax=Mucilaginibacter celer TaxID=2305508 RepID=A0A494VVW8_9SPHI|nr:hypothetical protein [Mucilaginibacter celer]AYL95405.1 hypothetical protein HYN43_008920 [Mucilaginibacter celer]